MSRFCGECGAEHTPTQKFCVECGSEIEASTGSATASSQETTADGDSAKDTRAGFTSSRSGRTRTVLLASLAVTAPTVFLWTVDPRFSAGDVGASLLGWSVLFLICGAIVSISVKDRWVRDSLVTLAGWAALGVILLAWAFLAAYEGYAAPQQSGNNEAAEFKADREAALSRSIGRCQDFLDWDPTNGSDYGVSGNQWAGQLQVIWSGETDSKLKRDSQDLIDGFREMSAAWVAADTDSYDESLRKIEGAHEALLDRCEAISK